MSRNQKVRSDAWGESLGEALRWQVYDATCHLSYEAAKGAIEEFLADLCITDTQVSPGDAKPPSRAAWYRFITRMRKADAARKIERVALSISEARGIARHRIGDETAAEAFKALAVDAAMAGDEKTASLYAGAAATIAGRLQKDRELSLRREKFEAAERRLAEATETVRDTALSDAERVAKIRSIFGLA